MLYQGIFLPHESTYTPMMDFVGNTTLEQRAAQRPQASKNKYCIKGLSRNKIRAGLILKGIQMRDIARSLKVSRPSVTRVVSGQMASARIRQEIAIRLGMPVSKLWPSRRRAARA